MEDEALVRSDGREELEELLDRRNGAHPLVAGVGSLRVEAIPRNFVIVSKERCRSSVKLPAGSGCRAPRCTAWSRPGRCPC